MRDLPAGELLSLWERGQAEPPVRRALALLAAACPETPPGELIRLPIGRRDRLLLELHRRTFGPELACVATCPACAESLEAQLAVTELLSEAAPSETPLALAAAGFEVRFRLPDSGDLLALDGVADPEAARDWLLDACLVEARTVAGEPAPTTAIPGELRQAMVARMGEADPQAAIELALDCPACAHTWLAPLDVVSFVWAEIGALARRLLHEVAQLAAAYGWGEAEILAMSPWRRQAYLELAGR